LEVNNDEKVVAFVDCGRRGIVFDDMRYLQFGIK